MSSVPEGTRTNGASRQRVPLSERKEQLIQATVSLMRSEGVQRVNLRAIADQAGASLGTVHYCFDDKDDLLRAAVDHWLQRMVDLPDPEPEAAQKGLAAVGMRIAEAFWAAFVDGPEDVLAQIELVLWAIRKAPRQNLAATIYDRYEEELARVFAEAMEQADEVPAWDPRDIGRAFLVIIDGACLQYMAAPQLPGHGDRYRALLGLLFAAAVATDP